MSTSFQSSVVVDSAAFIYFFSCYILKQRQKSLCNFIQIAAKRSAEAERSVLESVPTGIELKNTSW
jgi:hypothetical protein